MSASEKLRALDEAIRPMMFPRGGPFDELRNALPLIADEVGAAEAVLHEYDLWAEDANDGEFAIWSRDEFMASFLRLRQSLIALREGLDGD